MVGGLVSGLGADHDTAEHDMRNVVDFEVKLVNRVNLNNKLKILYI